MSLFDQPTPNSLTAAQIAANKVRRIMNETYRGVARQLERVREVVNAGGGRAAVEAELGGDAADLLTLFNAAKTMADTHPDVTVNTSFDA